MSRTAAARIAAQLGRIVVVVLVLGGAGVFLALSRPGAPVPGDATAPASPTALRPGLSDPAPTAPVMATVEPVSASLNPSPTVEPTAPAPVPATPAPTFRGTPAPMPVATPRATPRPTPAPVPDPRPEGTPAISTASGSFGATLVVRGISVTLDHAAPDPSLANLCRSDDPERQGWTELVAFSLTMTWPDPSDAQEPWVAVGSRPWNVLSFEPSVASGRTVVVTTCRRPADVDPDEKVEISPAGSPMQLVRWYFS
jgi:hypothetical protein